MSVAHHGLLFSGGDLAFRAMILGAQAGVAIALGYSIIKLAVSYLSGRP